MEKEEMIARIRKNIVKEYEKNPEFYEKQDVERLQEDDFAIKRYIYHKCLSEENAFQMLTESMKWRKDFGISQIRDNHFPREFYACGALFPYCKDKEGYHTLYLRVKMVKKIPEMSIFFKKFLAHEINKVDQQSNGNGWVLIIDASEAGFSNCDIEMLFFLITILKNHFPAALKYILAHELPWALRGVWKMAKAWVPGESHNLIKFTTNRDITQWIDENALPDFLGGNAKLDYKLVPDGCPDAFSFGTQVAQLPVEKVSKIVDHYRPFL